MSRLQELQEQLQDTEAALAHLDRAIAEGPSPSLGMAAASLQKRKRDLEADFFAAAKGLGVKVCSYRLFGDGQQPKLAGLAAALADFQATFSITFDALKNGPKERSRIAAEIAQSSAFEFAYAFTGSVGIVLTMPDQLVLLGETEFDLTIRTIADLSKSESSSAIAGFARRLGRAPIRLLYKWASDHAQSGLGADIEWMDGERVSQKLLIQPPQFSRLVDTIAATSDETVEDLSLVGILVGADVTRKTFHLKFPEGDEITGSFDDAISEQHRVTLPRQYRVILRKTTKIVYSTEKEDEKYHLVRVEDV